MKQKLFLLLFTVFSLTSGFSQEVVSTTPPNIVQCNNEVFDLTQQTSIILGDQDPQTHTVAYFQLWDDAFNNVNPIANPTNYVGVSGEVIHARVTRVADGAYSIAQFNLVISDGVVTNSPGQITVCDDGSGFATIDLTAYITQITVGNPDLTVTFYVNWSDAMAGVNAIANPANYVMPTDQYFIFYRADHILGCSDMGEMVFGFVECTDNTISGTLSHDVAGNGCESGTTPGAYVLMGLTHNNDVYYTVTDADGNYTFYNVPDGVSYVYVVGQGPFTYQTSPESYTVTTPGELTDNNFCLTEPDPVTDVAVFIYPHLQPRPGFPMSYTIILNNFGNTTESGTLTVTFDDAMVTYNGSTPAMTVSGNTLTIPYTNLAPYQSQFIYVDFTVLTPPTVDLGDLLTISAAINVPAADAAPANNETSLTQTVVNSLDPNDIACREGESITEEQADDYLNYTIRFQNIGDADAIFVTIEHPLDADLDPSTFQPISASHDYTMVLENNVLKLRYDNIHLAGAEVNEPESHGYFMFRIKPRSNVQLGDSFFAQASIVFDFNEPIVTNSYITTIESIAGLEENTANAFVIYPNPASHIINLQVNDIAAGKANVVVADVLGKTVMSSTIQLNGNTATLDVSSLNSGMYFVTLMAEGKQVTKKLVIE